MMKLEDFGKSLGLTKEEIKEDLKTYLTNEGIDFLDFKNDKEVQHIYRQTLFERYDSRKSLPRDVKDILFNVFNLESLPEESKSILVDLKKREFNLLPDYTPCNDVKAEKFDSLVINGKRLNVYCLE